MMNKKADLMNVFSFLADFLREEEVKTHTDSVGQCYPKADDKPKTTEPMKQLLVETHLSEMPLDDIDLGSLDKFRNNLVHIKNLMDRVETKAKEEAAVNSLLANQKRAFQQEIRKMKNDNLEKLKYEKIEQENLPDSATTDNVIIEAVGDGLGLGLSTRHKVMSVVGDFNVETGEGTIPIEEPKAEK